jgi:hypothetical protein
MVLELESMLGLASGPSCSSTVCGVAILADVLSPGSPPCHHLAPKGGTPRIIHRSCCVCCCVCCEKPRSVCRWPAGRTGESAIIEESRIGDDAARCVRAFRLGSDYRLVAAGAAMRDRKGLVRRIREERCPDLGRLALWKGRKAATQVTRAGTEWKAVLCPGHRIRILRCLFCSFLRGKVYISVP